MEQVQRAALPIFMQERMAALESAGYGALELSLLDADGNTLADATGALLMSSRLVLRTWPDDGGLLEIETEDDG